MQARYVPKVWHLLPVHSMLRGQLMPGTAQCHCLELLAAFNKQQSLLLLWGCMQALRTTAAFKPYLQR